MELTRRLMTFVRLTTAKTPGVDILLVVFSGKPSEGQHFLKSCKLQSVLLSGVDCDKTRPRSTLSVSQTKSRSVFAAHKLNIKFWLHVLEFSQQRCLKLRCSRAGRFRHQLKLSVLVKRRHIDYVRSAAGSRPNPQSPRVSP